ncbi:hypothetical protein AXK56_21425 [Tsukamurella pulmonis]|uniref:Lipoprotein n=1 Tax=Tsukamurella pulmonis TaxID=47312 RepID=A0A1H1B4P6_9ACTN|nr:hypothetical protein [Tsukamurella pulmonis]KXO94149.1 hypothetical protein AXK56_21425 [Tsukamurella pulmonis]SDQ46894.1 hypothetical protein SAMN04489765_0538 [Tsukamurella pulmonis]SUP25640.1 Uncharacterised protein [Tsukamurella pulmonis]
MHASRRSVILGALFVPVVAGCAPSEPAPSAPTVRDEVEPIRKRVKNIGDSFSARWIGRSNADDRNPGPSAVWLDAVIALGDEVVTTRLRDAAGTAPGRSRPELPAVLGDPGVGLTDAGLDAFVAVEPGTVRAFLYPERRLLAVMYFRG